MSVAATLKDYLNSLHFQYDTVRHAHTDSALRTAEAAHVSGELVAKPLLMGDEHSYVLVVIPASHRLEPKRLNEVTGRHLTMISEDELEMAFTDCEKGAVPAAGEAYGIDTLVDQGLYNQDDVYFESGDHENLIHMAGEQFRSLMANAQQVDVSHHM